MTRLLPLATAALLAFSPALQAQTTNDHAHDHAEEHGHDHAHEMTEAEKQVYAGYFEDSQVQPRALTDWAGDWQSVYPLLISGALDPVMAHKAEGGEKTAEEYRAYYETGYATDVDRIVIADPLVTFYRGDQSVSGIYEAEAPEILTYEKGNRGVRFIFKQVLGDPEAPDYIQFSDHGVAPQKAWHFHLYSGDDRAGLLANVTNWPTYYPASMSEDEVVEEMIAH